MRVYKLFACLSTPRSLRYATQFALGGALSFSLSAQATTRCLEELKNEVSQKRVLTARRNSKTVVIVDGTSAGAGYAQLFRAKGYQVIHLSSSKQGISGIASFIAEDYDGSLTHTDLKNTIEELRSLNPSLVIAGGEQGVSLAHKLAQSLKIPFRNEDSLAETWRNKFEAQKAARDAGLAVAKFSEVKSWEEAERWALSLADWPIVIKPLSSAGTEGVTIARNMEELRAAFDRIYGKENWLHLANDSVLLMEYLRGQEYNVDVVVVNGEIIVSDVWYYEREVVPGAATIYDFDRLRSQAEAEKLRLIEYAKQVVKALGINNGPAHIEIMLTAEGPKLVEMAARPCGGGLPRLVRMATGRNQLTLTVDAFDNPQVLKDLQKPYELNQEAAVVFITSKGGGARFSSRMIAEIESLPGVESVNISYKVNENSPYRNGDLLPQTIDSKTVIGQVNIVHPDPKVVDDLVEHIRRVRDEGAFETR